MHRDPTDNVTPGGKNTASFTAGASLVSKCQCRSSKAR